MAKVFVSSTFEDLKEYREAARETLRKLRHDVIAMEDYAASDERPRTRTLMDVAACDVYVGILGWRYGYIPPEDNPERLSITELEYRCAVENAKPMLIFMLQEDVRLPATVDNDRILQFRAQLSHERVVGFFKSVDDFVMKLAEAVRDWMAHTSNSSAMGLEHLPLAWRLVVDFKAYPDLLRHMDSTAFGTAMEKWEKENGVNRNLLGPERFEAALKELERKQSGHAPSELWLAWMRSTRANTPVAKERRETHEA